MSFLHGFRHRLRSLFRSGAWERDLTEEIRFHQELDAAEHGEAGVGPAARRRFGNATFIKEEARHMSWLGLADAAGQDVRFAVRTFSRRPAFTVAALLTIGLGMGATTAIYSVTDGVLFRPLPLPDADRIITVWHANPALRAQADRASYWDHGPVSLPEYRDWAAMQRSFTDVALYAGAALSVQGDDGAEITRGYEATATLLPVLGVSPALGRNFTAAEDRVGGPPVALVSYETWVSRYGSNPALLGRTVALNGRPYTIVGVLPRGLLLGRDRTAGAYWIPAGQDAFRAARRGYHDFRALGRLKPGVTLEAAAAEVAHVFGAPAGGEPEPDGAPPARGVALTSRSHDTPESTGANLVPLRLDETRDARQPLLILLGAAALLLVIACVNVATLLLGEATTRQPEFAARVALGAGRARLVRQLVAESVTLSLAGAALGVLLATVTLPLLVRLAPGRIPGLDQVRVDGRVLLVAAIAALLTGGLFGLAPALTLSASSPAGALPGRGTSRRGRGRLQEWLVGAEVALSLVLLVAAGLLGRSFAKLTSVDPGFRAEGLTVVSVALPSTIYPDSTAIRAFLNAGVERVAALPGVVGAAATNGWSFDRSNHSSDYEVEGHPLGPDDHTNAERRAVTPGFFRLAGIPLVVGREFTTADRPGTTAVIVISAGLARREFGGASPIDRRIYFMGAWRTVVGEARDVKFQRLSTDDPGTIYAPVSQMCCFGPNLVVRTSGDPATAAPSIRAALKQIAPQAAVTSLAPMTGLVAASYADERYRTMLIMIFATVAATLAAIGVYGVTARAVAQRTKEVAIRLALGAGGGSVVGMVVRRTLVGAGLGVAAGTVGALAAARVIAPYLFGVTATDPATYAGIVGFLALVSVAASWAPARRATRVQPITVLRGE